MGVQEIKAQAEDVRGRFERIGRLRGHFHFAQKKGYSGVGLYTKKTPSDVRAGFDRGEFDADGRWVEARFDTPTRKLSLVSCYFPSGSSGEERQAAKVRFLPPRHAGHRRHRAARAHLPGTAFLGPRPGHHRLRLRALTVLSRRQAALHLSAPAASRRRNAMLGYVTLGTNDLPRAAAFYDALLAEIGARRIWESERGIAWGTSMNQAGLGVMKPYDGKPATVGNGVMAAFVVSSRALVDRVYARAIALGAQDEGAAGPRGEGFYAGYFRDLDGNKLNVFCMG
jgi:catechol 2,3-dioxygenase-like lactoylglutathione lyase family enzyme